MLKTCTFSLLLFAILFSFGCSQDKLETEVPVADTNFCMSQKLGIDQLSRFSGIRYIPVKGVNIIDETSSHRWHWRMYNDTIEVAGGRVVFGDADFETFIFFKKNKKCVEYLSARNVYVDDNGVIIDGQTGEVLQSGYSWQNFYNLNFKLQKYVENEILVGEVSGVKFWMEFTPDVHRLIPYEYELYYHD